MERIVELERAMSVWLRANVPEWILFIGMLLTAGIFGYYVVMRPSAPYHRLVLWIARKTGLIHHEYNNNIENWLEDAYEDEW